MICFTEQLVQKEQQVTNQITQSKQEFFAALTDWNKHTKYLEERISIKDSDISELTTNVARHEQLLREPNAALYQKRAFITQLKVAVKKGMQCLKHLVAKYWNCKPKLKTRMQPLIPSRNVL